MCKLDILKDSKNLNIPIYPLGYSVHLFQNIRLSLYYWLQFQSFICAVHMMCEGYGYGVYCDNQFLQVK